MSLLHSRERRLQNSVRSGTVSTAWASYGLFTTSGHSLRFAVWARKGQGNRSMFTISIERRCRMGTPGQSIAPLSIGPRTAGRVSRLARMPSPHGRS
jgi:hypothetical protein